MLRTDVDARERLSSPSRANVTTAELRLVCTHESALCDLRRSGLQRSARAPERLLQINRGHWTIENRTHYVIDWNYDEDRSRIRTGHGPENISRLRRFAVGLIQSKPGRKVAETLRLLNRNIRLVFDWLLMTEDFRRTSPRATPSALPAAAPA